MLNFQTWAAVLTTVKFSIAFIIVVQIVFQPCLTLSSAFSLVGCRHSGWLLLVELIFSLHMLRHKSKNYGHIMLFMSMHDVHVIIRWEITRELTNEIEGRSWPG